jgi:RimJ/RimL family protein N-acetyltransferase
MIAFIKHKKIYLRALESGDIEQWAGWFNDHDVTQYMNKGAFPNTFEAQKEWFEKLHQSRADVQLGVVEMSSNKLVGVVGLHKIDWVHRTGDISILIGERDVLGKGYGAIAVGLMVEHAFNKLNLNKVVSGMWAVNTASEKCFISNGFELEGRQKEQYFYKGGYTDGLKYGLLRSNWQAGKGSN